MKTQGIRRGVLVTFLLAVLAVIAPVMVRSLLPDEPVLLEIEMLDGTIHRVTRSDLDRLPWIERDGEVQNQFGNWRDKGLYAGVRLLDLPGFHTTYDTVQVIAADGYRVEIDRWRVEDDANPMILSLSFDGLPVPAWEDGPRIVVLPDDGRVSNEEADLPSAGSLWVKNVTRLMLR